MGESNLNNDCKKKFSIVVSGMRERPNAETEATAVSIYFLTKMLKKSIYF